MVKRFLSVALVLLLLLVNTAGVLRVRGDDKDTVFDTNIDKWTFAGDGTFSEKTNYYGKNGKFMSHQTVQYAYAISEMEVSNQKSFTFEVEFDVPNYDTAGADNGWCWQTILLGVQNAASPSEDDRISITFQHYPEGQESISLSSSSSGYSENVGMPEDMIPNMSHKLIIYYSIVDESLKITIDGEEMFNVPKMKNEIQGKLGFGATWSCMRVLKAVYTELDETPAPVTPTPTPSPTPDKTDAPEATDKGNSDKPTESLDPKLIVVIVLAVLVVIAIVAVIVVATKRKK